MDALHLTALAGGKVDKNDAQEGDHFIHINEAAQRAIARLLVNRFGLSRGYSTAAPFLQGGTAE
ncbi:hypothetical protein [Niveispirillum sp. KHB5.9]|uniref:hypothetical protein n=1 Tax=Niveispirillum sp. KHB5.9 TaxID=3400269 RepID=UPI003A8A8333